MGHINGGSVISERCATRTLGAKNTLVGDCVPPVKMAALHDEWKRISHGDTNHVCVAEHLKTGVDELVGFVSAHAVVTPYSYSLGKCTDMVCCRKLRSPVENAIRDLCSDAETANSSGRPS